MVLLLGLFLFIPVLMAAVSVSDWTGAEPFASDVSIRRDRQLRTDPRRRCSGHPGLRNRRCNNLYYVLFVVRCRPRWRCSRRSSSASGCSRGRGFFRTAFYFPSVTSSVAITVLWLFLFSATGAVNKVLSWVSINGPNWVRRSPWRAARHARLARCELRTGRAGVDRRPGDLAVGVAGRSVDGDVGVHPDGDLHHVRHLHAAVHRRPPEHPPRSTRPPSWTAPTPGSGSGTSRCRCSSRRCSPSSRSASSGPGRSSTRSTPAPGGGPAKTTLTPAYLSFNAAFNQQDWGEGAAIAFILFAIIVFTILQRWVLRDRDKVRCTKTGDPRLQHAAVEAER